MNVKVEKDSDRLRDWLDKEVDDQIDWHRANGNHSENDLAIYRQAYRKGYLCAVGGAVAHGMLKNK